MELASEKIINPVIMGNLIECISHTYVHSDVKFSPRNQRSYMVHRFTPVDSDNDLPLVSSNDFMTAYSMALTQIRTINKLNK